MLLTSSAKTQSKGRQIMSWNHERECRRGGVSPGHHGRAWAWSCTQSCLYYYTHALCDVAHHWDPRVMTDIMMAFPVLKTIGAWLSPATPVSAWLIIPLVNQRQREACNDLHSQMAIVCNCYLVLLLVLWQRACESHILPLLLPTSWLGGLAVINISAAWQWWSVTQWHSRTHPRSASERQGISSWKPIRRFILINALLDIH